MRSLLALALLAVSTASCAGGALGGYTVTPTRVGALYPSKGEACGVRFENLTFLEASSKYENLGMISLTGASSDEFTDPMKHDVERAACKMGGDVVSLNTSGPSFFQFIVWRTR
ncbi:MAG TPA: hypothetical protein VIJ22_00420 [Polyangiaceae bacterium]